MRRWRRRRSCRRLRASGCNSSCWCSPTRTTTTGSRRPRSWPAPAPRWPPSARAVPGWGWPAAATGRSGTARSSGQGGLLWRALHTPGHEPHHICLYLPEEHALFTGDVLFIGRTGRTVAPGADTRQLYRSLRSRVLVLPDRTRLYPGHDYGPVRSRTLGEERAVNPWLQAEDEQAFVRVMQEYERRRRG
ncbi:MAG: hypothetical protein KatS3mg102_0903 [Planctomycetota bacterium]|nr:MAG: hypothetical protein KatS3mg102_0903 [Planctomycetota bacterium]